MWTAYLVDGLKNIVQRIGRVGVVHNGHGPILGIDGLEATTNRCEHRERCEHLHLVDAEKACCGIYGSEVVGIKPTSKLYLQFATIEH